MVDFSELEKLANADVEINDDDLSDTEDPDLLVNITVSVYILSVYHLKCD